MKSNSNIPQLKLKLGEEDVTFVCKTMQEIEMHRNDGSVIEGPHKHDYYTILLVLNGDGTHYIDFKSYPIVSGTIFFVSPGQVHHVHLNRAPEGYVLLFTDDFLIQNGIPSETMDAFRLFYACDEVKAIHPDELSMKRLVGYINQILAEFQSLEDFRFQGISAWLKLFLIDCKRLKSIEFPTSEIPEPGKMSLVNQFKKILESDFRKEHKVSGYASRLHVTSNYLNEVIKSETGYSPKELVQERIMLEIKRMAVYSDKSSKEIAYEMGFDDPAHFSKFVKNNSGLNFSELKEKLKK